MIFRLCCRHAIPVPCSVPSRLSPRSCLAVDFALCLAQTNVPPSFTLMLDVRDAPALPNDLRAAMVTWLPVMSAGVAADALCDVSCLAAGLLQDNTSWLLLRVVRSPFWLVAWCSGTRGFGRSLFGNFAGNRRARQANASWNRKSIHRSSFTPGPAWSGKVRWVLDNFPPRAHGSSSVVSFAWLCQTCRAIRQGVVVTKFDQNVLT